MSSIRAPIGYSTTLINTATTTSIGNDCVLGGILINTPTTGTIAIFDGAKTILETTGGLTATVPAYIAIPAAIKDRLIIVTTGTVSITVFWA